MSGLRRRLWGRRTAPGLALTAALAAALNALVKSLALEVAPVRVNLIAAGFVDTPLSAALLGDRIDERREQLRATLPIGRVVGPADTAALAVHLMINTAVTGATFDIDGGQQFVQRRAQGTATKATLKLGGPDRGLGIADVTPTMVATSKTTALRAESQFGAVSTVTQRTGTAAQNGGSGASIKPKDVLRKGTALASFGGAAVRRSAAHRRVKAWARSA